MGIKGDNARMNIINCAHELFCQKGYCGVTMKDICEKSGFSRGGLYRHFSSTEDIFIAIINQEQSQALNALQRAKQRGVTPDQILRTFLRARIETVAKPSLSFDVAVSEFATNSEKGREVLTKRAEDSVNIITELITSGNQLGVFKCSDPKALATYIIWLIEGMSRHSSLLPIDEELIKKLLNLINKQLTE